MPELHLPPFSALHLRGAQALPLQPTTEAPETEGAPARIRAYASFDEARLTDGPIFDQIGEGYFAILIDQGADMTPYQGITPLVGGSLSACAEAYFAQSEQLPTTFKLCYGKSQAPDQPAQWRAGARECLCCRGQESSFWNSGYRYDCCCFFSTSFLQEFLLHCPKFVKMICMR